MTDTSTPRSDYGVHSEVGRLRKVLVCSPGLAHERLTPTNCDDLLFDDVLWVQNARRDHFDFSDKMRDRGVDVLELHEVLAATMQIADAQARGCSTGRSSRTKSVPGSSTTPARSSTSSTDRRSRAS